MTATATRSADTGHRRADFPVVLTLGRFEGRQMVRHPLLWVGALAAVGLSIFELIEESPVLNRVSMTLAWTMAPIAVAVALLAGWAALRARGRTDAHPPAVMPAPMSLRMAGVIVGLTWPALVTFALQLSLLGWTYFRDPVTSLVWTELLVGPGFVALAGALSAAASRWFAHPSTPLVALFVLAGAQVVVPYDPGNWGSEIGPAALAPIAWPENIIPYEVSFRPSGLHLAYLIGLVLVISGVAVLGRAKSGWATLGIGLLLAGTLGPAQLGPIDESTRSEAIGRLVGDEADLTCETYDLVTYCAMPGYEGWIDDWAGTGQRILERLPGEGEPVEVRQYPVHNTFLFESPTDHDYWWWVPASSDDYAERDVGAVGSILADYTLDYELAGAIATELIGCDRGCEGEGQRFAYLWLVMGSEQVAENVRYNTSPSSGYASVEECILADVLEHPDGGESVVAANWELLTEPETTIEEVEQAFRVDVPEPTTEFGGIEGGCS